MVSVGNIVVGGTGKTPLVEALARDWLRRGGRPGLLSRGYRARGSSNDEYQLLLRRLPGIPHVQGRDRHSAGLELLGRHPEVDLILLDDGFQHRRLARDVDIVVIDATRPFGQQRYFPRGYLREPLDGLERAHHLVVTRAELVHPHKAAILMRCLHDYYPNAQVSTAELEFQGVRSPSGELEELDDSWRWGAFAGIGNPTAFFSSLERAGVLLVGSRTFRDHHPYSEHDLARILAWGESIGAEALICTEKDGVKLEQLAGFGETALPIFQLRAGYRLHGPHPLERLSHAPSHAWERREPAPTRGDSAALSRPD